MSVGIRLGAVVFVSLMLTHQVSAADQAGEDLPVPHRVAPAQTLLPLPLPSAVDWNPYQRQSQYDVWQYLAVDRHGYFRPRVIYSPNGAYYLYTGEPYGFTSTRQMDFMPYAYE